MAQGHPRDPRKERQWIREWRQSGLSVRVFCARRGLAQANFYAWRHELAKRDVEFAGAEIPTPDDLFAIPSG
jgi:hypothetical protein